MRATMPVEPPGGTGTSMRIGFAGYAWANADGDPRVASAKPAKSARALRRMAASLLLAIPARDGRRDHRLAVPVCDPFRDVRRQRGEPGARPGRVLRHVVPPLGDIRVGAHHEAIGKLEERLAPFRRRLAAGAVVGA